ncbi:ABC transporter permease [Catenulispora pinisilvae]|uniref:ABC transporter permease n=1 Tax=Catenulispora pinisilvae TaxID=2705253 RepID=UPI002B266A94|nr:FtsX-like permease family protein [Catenulispora pinisilvae]
MFRLVLQTVRERKAGFVGAFVALLGASMLITAFGIILQSGIGDGVPVQRYADASVVISGKQSVTVHEGKKSKTKPLTDPVAVPADLIGTVAHTDGVARAVAVVSFPAQVVGTDGRLVTGADDRRSLGANWSSAALGPFTLSGREPRRPEEIVLEQSVADRAKAKLGDTVRIASTRAASPYTVVGTVKYTGAGGALRTPPIFFTDATATTLFGRADQVSAIGVLATPGTDSGKLDDRIDAALKGAGVSSHIGAGRSSAENPDVASARGTLKVLAGSLGGTVVLITMLVVGSTLALGVHQRRRELALLRAIGATPKQIHKMIAGEVLVVALTGSLLGCPPGVLAAEALRGALSVIGVLPQDFVFSYGPIPMAAAVAIGVVTAQAAGFAVARRVVAIRPVEALSQAATEQPGLGRARVVFGTVLLVLGAAASLLPLFFGSIFAVAGAGSGGLIMVIAFLMLAPPLVARATRLLAAPFRRRFGNLGYLAVANTRANARRLAAGIGPLILAIGFASLQLFIPTTTAAAANDQARAGVLADYTLTGDAGGLPTDAVADVRALPGVAAVAGVVRVDLYSSVKMLGDPEVFDYQAEGLTTDGPATDGPDQALGHILGQVLDLDVTGGDLSRLSETTAAISDGAAATLGTRVGGTVRIHLPDGQTIQPQVVATYQRGLGFGDITLSAQTLLRHSSHRLYDSILVRLQPGADRKAALAELKALSTRYPGLHVQDKGGLSAAQQRTATAGLVGSAIPLLLIFGYIAVAVANTLVMTTLSRAREFALLRLVGATPAQVLRMMRTETLLVVLIAVAVGTLVPMLPLTMVSLGLTGSPVPSIPPLLYLAIVAATSALAAAAVLIPTRLALRARPVEAIGLRE